MAQGAFSQPVLHRASQVASWRALKTWSVSQHHCGMLPTIAASKFALSRKINLKIFYEGVGWSRLFRSSDYKSTYSYLNDNSYLPYKFRKAQVVSLLIFSMSLAMKERPGQTHFSSAMFIKKGILPKIMCHCVTKNRRSSCRSSLHPFHSPDLNPEHKRRSAQLFFLLITLFSWFISEKLLVHTLSQIMVEIMW